MRTAISRTIALLAGTLGCPLAAMLCLSWLCQASFGAQPSVHGEHHIVFGNALLFGFGCCGTLLAALTTFQLLRTFRVWAAVSGIVFVCFPALVVALCQLWAWALFSGWV